MAVPAMHRARDQVVRQQWPDPDPAPHHSPSRRLGGRSDR